MTYPHLKCCPCHEICTPHRESAAPTTKSVPHVAKMPPLPRNLHLVCESAAPATKSVPRVAKMPPLPRNRDMTACASIPLRFATAAPLSAKVPRLPQNLSATSTKCCACHAKRTSGCQSAAPATQSNVAKQCRVSFQWSRRRPRPETVPRPSRTRRPSDAATEVAFSQLHTTKPAEGCSFSQILFHRHTHTHVFSRAPFSLFFLPCTI